MTKESEAETAPVRSIADMPASADFGSLGGHDPYWSLFSAVLPRKDIDFLRDPDGHLMVFRHRHLRELAVNPNAGNTPPNVLANGRYEEMHDPHLFPPGTMGEAVRVLTKQVFFMNEPLHLPARRILVTQLSPKAVAELAPLADAVIAELLAELAGGGEIDFHKLFAERLTTRFWGDVLDLSRDEADRLPNLLNELAYLFLVDPQPEDRRRGDLGMAEYNRLVADSLRRTFEAGGNKMIDQVAAEVERLSMIDDPDLAGVTPPDVVSYLVGNLIDGFHTAALGVTNVMLAILEEPGLLDRLRADPSLVNAAVAEGLRIKPPVLQLMRYALADIVLDGVLIPKGSRITMCWAAGNFDAEAYPDPYRFDLARSHRGVTTFGAGAQICPGRLIVAMLAQRTLKAIVESDLAIAADSTREVTWLERSFMAQATAAPVRITPSPGV